MGNGYWLDPDDPNLGLKKAPFAFKSALPSWHPQVSQQPMRTPPRPQAAAAPAQSSTYDEMLADIERQMSEIAPGGRSPEEAAHLRAANQQEYQLGLLGMLSGDEGLQGAGGMVFKNALAQRQPKVTDKGTYDPFTGQYTLNPEARRETLQTKYERVQQLKAEKAAQEARDAREHGYRLAEIQSRAELRPGPSPHFTFVGMAGGQPVVMNDRSGTMQVAPGAGGGGAPAGVQPVATPDGAPVSLPPPAAPAAAPKGLPGPLEPKPGVGTAASKLPADVGRMAIAFTALSTTLDQYAAAMESFDPRNPADMSNPTKRAAMEALAKRVMLEAKEAASLGALTGPDVGIIEGMLANPGSFKGVLYGKKGMAEQAAQMRAWIRARQEAVARQYPGAYKLPPGGGAAPPGAPAPTTPGALTPEEAAERERLRKQLSGGK